MTTSIGSPFRSEAFAADAGKAGLGGDAFEQLAPPTEVRS
jgi:hypothetical protein